MNNPWGDVIELPINGREPKPRAAGWTMVIDKGLGLGQTADLLEAAADYIDLVKIGFGTSVLYPRGVLEAKIRLIKSYGVDVCPGGTLLEVACWQGRLEPFLERARVLGFTFIEVSDGTITMSPKDRAATIRKSLAAGFRVVSEVGKKDPLEVISPRAVAQQILFDLEQGAQKVIMEGRDSGKGVGVYDRAGGVKEADLETIVAGVGDPGVIIWEAPLKDQQQVFLARFGPNANLGNVQPGDVLALEALRVGLRSDTLQRTLAATYRQASLEAGATSEAVF